PWQRPFLPDLKNVLEAVSDNAPALLIVPNKRPARYVARLYAQEGKPPPSMMTIAETAAVWCCHARPPLRAAGELDRAALLHSCVRDLAKEDALLSARFAGKSLSDFLPWGLRLAALLEECFIQRVQAADMAHVEVAAPAAALLGALGRLHSRYLNALSEHGWTTPGLDYAVACQTETLPPLLQPLPDRPVFIAGFFLLTKTQDCLLSRLWQAGAHICLHTDPLLATQQGHWACAEHSVWLHRWKAQVKEAVPGADYDSRPRIFFFSGYDCHSQLQELRALLLSEADVCASTALVLPDSGLLMPALHHITDKNINISMGYPLSRTSVNRLLEILFCLQTTATEDGRYYWRTFLQCLRHPYLNMLKTGGTCLREALQPLQGKVGSCFVDLDALTDDYLETITPPLRSLLADALQVLVRDLARVKTTLQMGDWLLAFCHFLITYGGDLWSQSPLDAEALNRLQYTVAPVLRESSLSEEFPMTVLHEITRQTVRCERIPFEAEQLTGLQVLGPLETRLLHFDRVIFLDATDDKLPGNPPQDPLLPNPLRRVLGLPDARSRELAFAHTLYRLCAGANEVHFFWQEGVNRSAFTDGKKTRSRFIEQLIWEEEQRDKTLLKPDDMRFKTASCTVRAQQSTPKSLQRSYALDTTLHVLLRKPLSATLLDVYLRCPLRFAWQYLCRLDPLKEPNEGDDPVAVGNCLHKTLHALYMPYIGKEVCRGDISRKILNKCFAHTVKQENLRHFLPADSYLMLLTAVPLRLEQYLNRQPERTTILCLEHSLSLPLLLAGQTYSFKGIMDRLDLRDKRLHVMDYKTGFINKSDATLWSDSDFFEKIRTACGKDARISPVPLFEALRERLSSLQLPCYLAMLGGLPETHNAPPGNAAFVNLRDTGAEMPLFGDLEDDERQRALEYCELALALTVEHMKTAKQFAAAPDRHCAWCPYAALCGT
ncbi:MAG: PD-(D/E)XK nuclease family protein, partial [Desulfovibrio sp.]|nr:PD-(D/E)XK nuclease family protein [Desulfovibrio sp.]